MESLKVLSGYNMGSAMIQFSFVIPCLNEARHIRQCLQSLQNQTIPRDQFEIIVVDNGSSDDSVRISRELADKVCIEPDLKVGALRNFGARLAQGEILIFIDADCTLPANWLDRLSQQSLSSNQRLVLGGGCELPPDATWIETHWLLEGPNGNALPKDLLGCSIVIGKSFFNEVGGFNETMSSGEDSELSTRLKNAGGEVHISRDANVIHWGNAKTQKAFVKRQIWHAESYSEDLMRNLKDPVFLITVGFGFCLAATVGAFALQSSSLWLFATFLFLFPIPLTLKRYKRASRVPRSLSELARSYYLDLLYLSARLYKLVTLTTRRILLIHLK
jgi:glycosyltransferase involved in cell wall biosynthesis